MTILFVFKEPLSPKLHSVVTADGKIVSRIHFKINRRI